MNSRLTCAFDFLSLCRIKTLPIIMPPANHAKPSHTAIRVLAFIIFVMVFIVRARDLPIADEFAFLEPIEKWVATGPQSYGLWHTPFYPWVLMLVGNCFGIVSAVTSRSVNLICVLFSALAMWRTASLLRPKLNHAQVSSLIIFSLLSPMALACTLLLDYDTTLLVASTSFYFYCLARFKDAGWKIQTAVSGLALALCLMSKETTPIFYPAAILVLISERFGVLRGLLATLFSFFIGAAVFAAFSWAWCAFYHLPFAMIFEMDLVTFQTQGGAKAVWAQMSVGQSLWTKLFPIFWAGVPMVTLFAFRLPELLKKGGVVRAITLVVLGVILVYTFALNQRTYYFPKYMAPVLVWLPWLCVVSEKKLTVSRWWAVGIISWFVFIPIDALCVLYLRGIQSLALSLCIIFVPLAVRFFLRIANRPSLGEFTILLGIGLSANYCREALLTSHSITYWYGERANNEAQELIAKWRLQHPDGTIFALARDFAYNNRASQVVYASKSQMEDRTRSICADPHSTLIVTRLRDDASLAIASELQGLSRCLKVVQKKGDLVFGANTSYE